MSKRKSKGFLNLRIFALLFLFIFSASMAMGQTPLLKPVYIHLSDLANVSKTAPTDGQYLSYVAATGLWTPAAGAGGAPTTAHYLTDQAEVGLSAEVVVTANGKALVTAANYAAMKALLDLEIGTDVPALAHTMASHSDDDTYNISTSGSAAVTKGFFHGAITTATPSGAFTIDWTAKQVHQVTITGANLDITFTNPSAPCRLWLVVIQGDGDDTIDWTHEADILWPGAVDPVLSTGSGDIDIVSFIWDGTRYLGVANYDFD